MKKIRIKHILIAFVIGLIFLSKPIYNTEAETLQNETIIHEWSGYYSIGIGDMNLTVDLPDITYDYVKVYTSQVESNFTSSYIYVQDASYGSKYEAGVMYDNYIKFVPTSLNTFDQVHIGKYGGVSFDNVYITKIEFINAIEPISNITNLTHEIVNINDVQFNYVLPTDQTFSHLEVYQDGVLLLDNVITNQVTVNALDYERDYTYSFYAVDISGNKSDELTQLVNVSNPALVPISHDLEVVPTVSHDSVRFDYVLPVDDSFSHLKVYRDNELVQDNWTESYYTDNTVVENLEYNYQFVMVTTEGIESVSQDILIETNNNDVPLDPVQELSASPRNASVVLNWKAISSNRLKGYNVYMNGIKLNTDPIQTNNYIIDSLENGLEHEFYITSVNTFDIESVPSELVYAMPTANYVPAVSSSFMNMGYVGETATNFVQSLWVPLAFSVGISLSFYVLRHVQMLFFR